jgi:ferredoxin
MATARVEPAGIELEVLAGESVMAAAVRTGYRWPTVCGGQGTCRTCFFEVVEGATNLSPVESFEREGLDSLGPIPGGNLERRLACQARVMTGTVTVRKRGVRLLSGSGPGSRPESSSAGP